ncbi:MAG: hypothetical protein ABI775_00960 [Pseudonocardiales bacterium]
MTFQPPPPPPPPGGPPPPPGGQPPGYGPPPPGGNPYGAPGGNPYVAPGGNPYGAPGGNPYGPGPGAGFDPKSVSPLDWGIIGAGVLAFIFSFVSFYKAKVSVSGGCPSGVSDTSGPSESAWHGFFGWFGVFAAVVGAVLVAISLFAPQVKLPVPARMAGLIAFAVATLSELLAFFIHPGTGQSASTSFGGCKIEAHVGHGVGYWITLLAVIAGLVLSLMRFQQSGGVLPGALGKMGNLGGHGPGGNQPPAPPPPGYGPPAGGGGYGPPTP